MIPTLIDTSTKMDAFVSQLDKTKLIAVDTEFQRETTYYPQLALVQIATENVVACIDPLAFDAKPALQKILLNENIIKVFHSCSQDIEVLYYYLGSILTPIYDTQIANALLSEHQQIGYANLVDNELDIQLDKSQTRTNWLQRPLTEKQIQYAGDDVFYLFQLHEILDKKLDTLNRKKWFNEESLTIASNETNFQIATDQLWKRVKHATRLPRKSLAIVQAIAIWREQLAQQNDKVRKRILADELIIQLAESPPENIDKLDQILGRQYQFSNEEKTILIEVISTAEKLTSDNWPDNRFNLLQGDQKVLMKELQKIVNTKAEELGISNTLLFSRKALEKLILANDAADITHNWRYHCIGQKLIDIVQNTK